MKLISRARALQDNEFASHIYRWQQEMNPSAENDILEEGEYYDEKLDSYRFYSKAELLLNHKNEITNFKNQTYKPPKEEKPSLGCLVIDSLEKDDIGYCVDIVKRLTSSLDLELILIPLFRTKWFLPEEIKENHKDTLKAYQELKRNIKDDNYEEGILLKNVDEVQDFLHPYFSLITGNYISYGFFYSEKLKVVFSYHYSGQLWMYAYSKDGLKKTISFAEDNNLSINPEYSWY